MSARENLVAKVQRAALEYATELETERRTGIAPQPATTSGAVFPPYGRSKGLPVAGASLGDLQFYASGCERTLADPVKQRWHQKESALLEAIRDEMARQTGPQDGPPAHGDADAPGEVEPF